MTDLLKDLIPVLMPALEVVVTILVIIIPIWGARWVAQARAGSIEAKVSVVAAAAVAQVAGQLTAAIKAAAADGKITVEEKRALKMAAMASFKGLVSPAFLSEVLKIAAKNGSTLDAYIETVLEAEYSKLKTR